MKRSCFLQNTTKNIKTALYKVRRGLPSFSISSAVPHDEKKVLLVSFKIYVPSFDFLTGTTALDVQFHCTTNCKTRYDEMNSSILYQYSSLDWFAIILTLIPFKTFLPNIPTLTASAILLAYTAAKILGSHFVNSSCS